MILTMLIVFHLRMYFKSGVYNLCKNSLQNSKLNNKALNLNPSNQQLPKTSTSIEEEVFMTEQNEVLSDIEEQLPHPITSERFILENDGINKLTADLLTRSNIHKDGFN